MVPATLPVWDFTKAREILKRYTLRWIIERYHFCLKGACRVEQLQLSSAERLAKAIATFAVVAWRYLYLTYCGRDWLDVESELGLSLEERETLYRYYNGGKALPSGGMGLKRFVRWLAQLGGFWERSSDGPAGAKTIWGYGNDSNDKGSFAKFLSLLIAETRILSLNLTFSTLEDSQKGDRYKAL